MATRLIDEPLRADAEITMLRLLDTAEGLFADQGIDVSARAINAAAGMNPAAIHYHFGTKDDLLRAVIARRQPGIAARQGELLDRSSTRSSSGSSPAVRRVVEAMVVPLVELVENEGDAGRAYVRLLARLVVDRSPALEAVMLEQFGDAYRSLDRALRTALPDLATPVIVVRRAFAADSIVHAVAHEPSLAAGWPAGRRRLGHDHFVSTLIDYVSAGLAAPDSSRTSSAGSKGRTR